MTRVQEGRNGLDGAHAAAMHCSEASQVHLELLIRNEEALRRAHMSGLIPAYEDRQRLTRSRTSSWTVRFTFHRRADSFAASSWSAIPPPPLDFSRRRRRRGRRKRRAVTRSGASSPLPSTHPRYGLDQRAGDAAVDRLAHGMYL
jgi:hypothetical protein